MSATITATTTQSALPVSKLDKKTHGVNESKTPNLYTVDDLIYSRSQLLPDVPLVAYPAGANSRAEYVHYTAADLNRFADHGAEKYAAIGLIPQSPNSSRAEVVAILAPSNLDYIACVFALTRLGFAVLFLSNRLATEGYVNLLQKTNCTRIISSENHNKAVGAIKSVMDITQFPMLKKSDYDVKTSVAVPPRRQAGSSSFSDRIAFIIHSSGSTGLPKPISQSHKACLSNYASSFGYRSFLTLPLYHNHGLSSFFRAVYSGKEISLFNANLPLSGTNLIEAMTAAQPEIFYGVPYALKLLAETQAGIQVLKNCKLVLFGGSSCPDDLGDRLVAAGVYLVGHYGATEMGQLMTSFRTESDKAWNYVRPLATTQNYIQMAPRAPNTFECVVLDGLPSKVVSNCDDPPNSFNTSDLFSPHPTIPNAWKYLGRLDDRVTLVNGEKVLPIPFEHQVRENELVKEAIVFGIGKSFPGLIIIPSDLTRTMEKSQLLDLLWPVVQAANSRVESFSHVSKEMIEILDVDVEYPCTDKGTVIRAGFYKKFDALISSIYERFEAPAESGSGGALQLSQDELKDYLLKVFSERLSFDQLEESTDFFQAGVDSLQAITARGIMMRELDLGGNVLGQNVVFEHPNVSELAAHLFSVRTGKEVTQKDEIEVMKDLIQKYSDFPAHVPGSSNPSIETVILTGATGSLGAHVLSQLSVQKNVKSVYALVRASSPETARQRVISTLAAKDLITRSILDKIICLPSDLSRSDLGLDESVTKDLTSNLTTIIHCAWAVNFNLGVQSFEQQHIKGTYNLLNTCLKVTTAKPARLFFCSSISAAAGTPLPATISETYITDLSHAQNMGYARSKLVTETIIKAASNKTNMVARVLRVGQIVGDTRTGLWNSTEAISLMIRSAVTIGALPALEETPSWFPVDVVAQSMLALSGITHSQEESEIPDDSEVVYHVQNSRVFHWTHDLLPALRDAGLEFETVPQRQWLQRLRDGDQNPETNPTIKLLDFFEGKYDNDKPGRKGLVFLTDRTSQKSEAIRNGYDVVGSGLVRKFIDSWRLEW